MAKKWYSIILLLFLFLPSCHSQKFNFTPASVNKIVHLDSQFSAIEVKVVKNALTDWSDQTENMVTWDLQDWPDTVTESVWLGTNNNFHNCRPHVLIVRTFSDDSVVINMETKLGRGIAGFATIPQQNCGVEYIYLIMDKIQNLEELRLITLHEIGHNLKLKHRDGHSIMTESVGFSSGVTKNDLKQFCDIWRCN